MHPLHFLTFLLILLQLVRNLIIALPQALVLLRQILNFLDQISHRCMVHRTQLALHDLEPLHFFGVVPKLEMVYFISSYIARQCLTRFL